MLSDGDFAEHQKAEQRGHQRRDDDVHQRVDVGVHLSQDQTDAQIGAAGGDHAQTDRPQHHGQVDTQRRIEDGAGYRAGAEQQQGRRKQYGGHRHEPEYIVTGLGTALRAHVHAIMAA